MTDHFSLVTRALLATNPTFDANCLTDVIDEPSHIRFDIPSPSSPSTSSALTAAIADEEDAQGDTDHDLDDD